MMNNPEIVEASRNIVYKVLDQNGSNVEVERHISTIFKLITSRTPIKEELNLLVEYFENEQIRFKNNPAEAEAYLNTGTSPHIAMRSDEEMAAYAMVANSIYNLDESITRS